jgi:galactitol-specific phosphotransferase system IIB component
MAVPTNTYQTFQTVGIKEELSDAIYNIAPTETPFTSMIAKGKVKNTYFEHQIDTLAAANADNATVEGDDATTDAAVATTRVGNYVQLMDKVVRVASTNQAVDSAGRKNEMAYQVSKRGKELKRDIESMCLSNNASVAGNASTARKSAGVGAWLETNTSHGATGSAGGFLGGIVAAPTDGTNRTLTETLFKDAISDAWDGGGDPSKVIVNSALKKEISTFSGIATQYRENSGVKQGTILGAADVYVSDFGEVSVIADRFMPAEQVYILDPEYWSLEHLQPMKTVDLAKTGHSDRKMLSCELGLRSKNEAANAAIYDVVPA